MIENINIFDFNLSDEDMAQIKLLNLNHSLFNGMINNYKMEEFIMENTLNLVTTWDKTFPKNNNINHQKVLFITAMALH